MKQKLVLQCELSTGSLSYANSLIEQAERKFNLASPRAHGFKPHFTLKYPFECLNNELESFESLLTTFSANHVAPAVNVGGIGTFKEGDVIYLKVVLSDFACKLFTDLISNLKTLPWMTWSENDGSNLNFHVTIANHAKAHSDELLKTFENNKEVFQTKLDNLTLYRFREAIGGVNKWDFYRTYKLNSSEDCMLV